jgi:ribonuclease D
MKLYQREISKEEVEKLALIQYEGPIHVIQSDEEFEAEIDHMAGHKTLGFDTETRPSFKKGIIYPTSLIQISTSENAWLIRVSRMGYPERLLDLLTDKEVIKVGTGLNDDIRKMKSDFNFDPGGFLDLQQYVEAFHIDEKGLKKLSAIILGHRISKSQQVSNWDADVLTEAQLRYAATDAWVCLEIYNALRKPISDHHG